MEHVLIHLLNVNTADQDKQAYYTNLHTIMTKQDIMIIRIRYLIKAKIHPSLEMLPLTTKFITYQTIYGIVSFHKYFEHSQAIPNSKYLSHASQIVNAIEDLNNHHIVHNDIKLMTLYHLC